MAEDLNKLKKQIEDLRKQYQDITKEPASLFKVDNVKEANRAVKDLTNLIYDAKKTADELEEGFGGISASIKAAFDEMKRGNTETGRALKTFKGIDSITTKLKYDQQGLTNLSYKQLKASKDRLGMLQQELKDQARIISQKYEGQLVDRNGNELYGAALDNRLASLGISKKEYENIKAILAAQKEGFSIFKETNKLLDERIKKQKSIEKSLGLMGATMGFMAKIPIVGKFIAVEEAMEAANEAVEAGAGEWGALGVSMKALGKGFLDKLGDPLVVIGLLYAGLVKIKDILVGIDKSVEEFARGMNVTYKESMALYKTFQELPYAGKEYTATLLAIGKQLGSNAKLNREDLEIFTKLRMQAGLTNEELMGAQMLSLANGNLLEKNIKQFMAQAKITATNNKVVLNEKQLLTEIDKISKSIVLSTGKNTNELAKVVTTAKALGMEMQQLENIQKGLLDFESSIENELSAELLIGRDLNLETARRLALNNDIAGMAQQINAQLGGSAEFAKMNVIQQEAMAKAVGMSREELANTLFTQEALKGLSEDEAARRQQLLDKRIEEVGLAQAQRELENGTIENLEQQIGFTTSLEQLWTKITETFGMQFIGLLEKAYDFFQKLVKESGGIEGFVGGIVDKIKSMVSWAKLFFQIWGSIKAAQIAYNVGAAISLAIQQKQAKSAQQEAGSETVSAGMKTFGGVPLVGIGLAAAAAVATFAGLYSLMNDGVISPSQGKSGYGDRVLFGPEGAISFNNKDTIVAGTNLGINKADDAAVASAGKLKIASTSNSNRDVINAINKLGSDINTRPIHVSVVMDGKEVSKSIHSSNSNYTSDQINNVNYKTQ
jgi:hypothetical protein